MILDLLVFFAEAYSMKLYHTETLLLLDLLKKSPTMSSPHELLFAMDGSVSLVSFPF
jgi:hypothetical protein